MSENNEKKVAKGFGVYDEWGSLKEVIVGRGDTAMTPDWSANYEYFMQETKLKDVFRKHPRRRLQEVYPKFAEEYAQQLDDYAATLEEHGVKVHRPREFTEEELASDVAPGAKGIWQSAPADCVWVVGRNYIEMEQRVLITKKNKLWARDVFMPHIRSNNDVLWHATPVTWPALDAARGPYSEGGDIVLVGNGKDVLMGVEQASTDELGFLHLQRILELDGYKLHKVFFDMYEIHLLAQLNLINPNLGIMCSEAFERQGQALQLTFNCLCSNALTAQLTVA